MDRLCKTVGATEARTLSYYLIPYETLLFNGSQSTADLRQTETPTVSDMLLSRRPRSAVAVAVPSRPAQRNRAIIAPTQNYKGSTNT
eukprot:scaffold4079_cov129-Isochrysis_galbana.AAC.1